MTALQRRSEASPLFIIIIVIGVPPSLSTKRLRPALLGLFERKEIVHPFPSKHRSARRASTLLLTMECVGSVSLEFVLNKSDSDIENNSQQEN